MKFEFARIVAAAQVNQMLPRRWLSTIVCQFQVGNEVSKVLGKYLIVQKNVCIKTKICRCRHPQFDAWENDLLSSRRVLRYVLSQQQISVERPVIHRSEEHTS